MDKNIQTDFLVVGAGIAGLTFAIKTARHFPHRRVTILMKQQPEETNTRYAQGGIAAVIDHCNDSFEQHIQDTLEAGDGCCDEKVVRMVVHEGPERVKELAGWGAKFDKDGRNHFRLNKEGGHAAHRIIHHKDITGREVHQTLLKQARQCKNIKLLDHHFAVDLLVTSNTSNKRKKCQGVWGYNLKNGCPQYFYAAHTLLATGGSGQLYRITTNPRIATGDGVAMAYRAGARIQGMAFVQFHPTALYEPEQDGNAFLNSEAVRGFGAQLKNKFGTSFMQQYDARGSLAPRDITARAIDWEMKKTDDDHVGLDLRHLDIEKFREEFPHIYKKCEASGIDVSNEMVPVTPAAHYFCGGISVDRWGRTSIKRLSVCGECSHTGLHGANRLASNSLLEGLVFAHRCFLDIARLSYQKRIKRATHRCKQPSLVETSLDEIEQKRKNLQYLMQSKAGIIKTTQSLKTARSTLKNLDLWIQHQVRKGKISIQLLELTNLVTIGHLVVDNSLQQRQNRGLYFNKDLIKELTSIEQEL